MKRPTVEVVMDLHVYGGLLVATVGTSLAYSVVHGAIVAGLGLFILGMKVI